MKRRTGTGAPAGRRAADHVINLGPEGGDAGGRIIATDTPEEVAATATSYTGAFLARVLAPRLEETKRRA